eukprot:CAMPEP_0115870134 /NCGR_PEP_ID=MMETSP0287-20121206/22165_1 /TAXON_ID=412157 /ORGANISM="Chrysochromulina rotalis, Strain UIO044" /LENGTH=124 /DNA_ID=CAMNT_0003324837 /DNA_START=304 /DNA_END=678 /DNA_ORIENTATION=-
MWGFVALKNDMQCVHAVCYGWKQSAADVGSSAASVKHSSISASRMNRDDQRKVRTHRDLKKSRLRISFKRTRAHASVKWRLAARVMSMPCGAPPGGSIGGASPSDILATPHLIDVGALGEPLVG